MPPRYPTVKISSNSKLAGHKDNWIDFNAGRMVEDMTKEELAKELLDYVLACCFRQEGEVGGSRLP